MTSEAPKEDGGVARHTAADHRPGPPSSMLERFPALMAGVAALVASLAVIGWVIGVPALARVGSNLPPMNFFAAVAVIALSVALVLHAWTATPHDRNVGLVCAALALAIGLVTLLQYIFDFNIVMNDALVEDAGEHYSGRMSPQSAAMIVTAGIGAILALLDRGLPWRQGAALTTLVLATSAGVGLAFGVRGFYGVTELTGPSLPTAVGIACLSLGLLASDPDRGVVGLLRAPGAGGAAARLMLPATIVVPIVAALATFLPESLNAISARVAESVFVLVALVIPAVLILVAAARLESVDRERAAARRGELESERQRETVRGEAERAAAQRVTAEREASRARALQAASEALARAVTVAEVLGATVQHALEALDAANASAGLLHEDRSEIEISTRGIDESIAGRFATMPIDAARPAAATVREGRAHMFTSRAEAAARFPEVEEGMRALGIEAFACVPIEGHESPRGFLAASFATERELGPRDRAVLATLASQCAQALARAELYEREHEVATRLQISMLASRPPDVSGIALATRYRAAIDELEVGGDWHDVISLPGGRLGLAVGDVVGRGLGAATAMGRLRSALHAIALSEDDPGQVLERLDLFAQRIPEAHLATVAYAIVDATGERLHYASAGHLPPVLAIPGRRPQLLAEGRSVPLASYGGPRESASTRLSDGALLVLYTDGLVERRGESLDAGLERLSAAVERLDRSDIERAADALLEDLVGDQAGRDDVAVLLAALATRATRPFRRRFPAEPHQLSPLRHELRAWLTEAGIEGDVVDDVLLASSEACANAIEHAGSGVRGEITFEAVCDGPAKNGDDGALTLRVHDRGHWPAQSAVGDRGRGIPLMRAVMDRVEFETGPDGTTVTMRRALRDGAG